MYNKKQNRIFFILFGQNLVNLATVLCACAYLLSALADFQQADSARQWISTQILSYKLKNTFSWVYATNIVKLMRISNRLNKILVKSLN